MIRRNFFIVLTLTLVMASCGFGSNPKKVADAYWKAAVSGDMEAARANVTEESYAYFLEKNDSFEKFSYELGDVTTEGDTARVKTNIKDEGGQPLALDTVLIKQGGKWKVDVTQTSLSLFGGAMQGMVQGLQGVFQEAAGTSQKAAEELQKAAKDMEKAMQDSMKAMEEGMKDLDAQH